MKLIVIAISFLFTLSSEAFIIKGADNLSPAQLSNLKKTANKALATFEELVAPIQNNITLDIAPKDCMRVGYNFTEKKVNFCAVRNVKSFGLNSADVINHELFHAFLCSLRPSLCHKSMSVEQVALHEGLADWFAFIMKPDRYFGESFYLNTPYVREYNNRYCYSLAPGKHAKGSAVASELVKLPKSELGQILKLNNLNISEIFEYGLLKSSCFASQSPSLRILPKLGTASKRNKYKIPKTGHREFLLDANDSLREMFPNYNLRFVTGSGDSSRKFKIERIDGGLIVSSLISSGFEKVIVVILNSKSEQVGAIPLYLKVSK